MKKIEQIQKQGQAAIELAKKTLAQSKQKKDNPIQPIEYKGEMCSDEVNKKRFAQSLSNVNSFLTATKIQQEVPKSSLLKSISQSKAEQLVESINQQREESELLKQSIIKQEEYYADRETQILLKLKQLDTVNQHLTDQNLTLQKQLAESNQYIKDLKQQLQDAKLQLVNQAQQKQIYAGRLAQEMKKTATLQYQLSLVIQSSFTDLTQQELLDLFKVNSSEILPQSEDELNNMISQLNSKIEIIGNVNEFIDKVENVQNYEDEIKNLKLQLQARDQVIQKLQKDRQRAAELLGIPPQ